jgi:hypothetical protein
MRTVAFATIRLDSKRLPRKNVMDLGGRPLCAHITGALLQVMEIDEGYAYCGEWIVPDGAYNAERVRRHIRGGAR